MLFFFFFFFFFFIDLVIGFIDIRKYSDNEKFIFLMNLSDYDTLISILRYINGAFEKRKLFDI